MSSSVSSDVTQEASTAAILPPNASKPPNHLLYNYWRSSSAWRVRIALNYKDVPYTAQPINLLTSENRSSDYLRINPSGTVPTLVVSYEETQQQLVISQSNAILEWIEETHQEKPLLPNDPSQSISHQERGREGQWMERLTVVHRSICN
jgi:glutathione S-transferase